ncbi:MAG: helix-turn-helix transcriptional regulator, partial [Clostridia bacterium]|nr:helix-turn-helix transcriptional regulator [Clostridia bacterium]
MNIGNQIRALRLRRGVTQEEMAQHFGITAQAVSKWECGASAPDISVLPELSAYFGVTIDALFALSDEIRMERIQNMLWDTRFLNPADVENERHFLLDKARREEQNSEPYEMLANLELHLADEHDGRAEEYALAALDRDPESGRGYAALSRAMGGRHVDPRNNYHPALISHCITKLKANPDAVNGYAWLIAQLIDDHRLEEAKRFCDLMETYDNSYFVTVQRIKIALAERENESASAMWAQLEQQYADNWSVHHWIGDFRAQTGDYDGAIESYRKSLALMDEPHYTDPHSRNAPWSRAYRTNAQ